MNHKTLLSLLALMSLPSFAQTPGLKPEPVVKPETKKEPVKATADLTSDTPRSTERTEQKVALDGGTPRNPSAPK